MSESGSGSESRAGAKPESKQESGPSAKALPSQRVGRIRELWRYPVKSMAGEPIERSAVLPGVGLVGDRGWAVRDDAAGEIRSAKKWPGLLGLRAQYLEEPVGSGTPRARIHLPGGETIDTDGPSAAERVGAALGKRVSLHPRVPAADIAHYRRAEPIRDMVAEMRETSALLPDEPLPDLGEVPVDFSLVIDHVTPPGTYFDFFQLHLLTDRSLESLASLAPDSEIDVRRFRPNLVIELDPGIEDAAATFPEFGWCGRGLAIGALEVQVVMPMLRCVMTTHAQAELPKDPTIMRTMVRESKMSMGVGAQVLCAGEVAVGDEVRLIESS